MAGRSGGGRTYDSLYGALGAGRRHTGRATQSEHAVAFICALGGSEWAEWMVDPKRRELTPAAPRADNTYTVSGARDHFRDQVPGAVKVTVEHNLNNFFSELPHHPNRTQRRDYSREFLHFFAGAVNWTVLL